MTSTVATGSATAGPRGLAGLSGPARPRQLSSDHVYRRLRQALLTQRISPGTRLVETDIADRLQTSRTPVREALRRLEGEGFALRAPGGGLVSADFGPEELADIFLVRAQFDLLAARLACERGTPEQWMVSRGLLEEMRLCIQRHGVDSPAFHDVHEALHASIYRIAFSQRMAGWIDNHLRFPLEVSAELSYGNPAPAEPPYEQHVRLVDAIASGDVERAVAAATEHCSSSAADASRSRCPEPHAAEL